MQKNISVTDLRIGQSFENIPFALKELEVKMSRQGKQYYNVNYGDKSGEIRGKIWTENMRNVDEGLKVGDIVSISGEVQEYAGKPQVIISRMNRVTDMAPEEFLPTTSRDRSQMADDIEVAINSVQNENLKALLLSFWNNPEYKDKFINYPAGMYVHHGYVGGLLEHVWEMWQLSQPYLKIYPKLNRDLYFTGLFFHDIGKLEELDVVGATIVMTKEGSLLAHISLGVLFLEQMIRKEFSDFPVDLKNKLFHLILSHQGELEYGSPVKPQMLESIVLSMVDANGADMNQATKHIEKHMDSEDEFTEYHKWLRRSLYKGD